MLNVDHIVTGHNADDIAETVLMNSKSKRLVVLNNERKRYVGKQNILRMLTIIRCHVQLNYEQ